MSSAASAQGWPTLRDRLVAAVDQEMAAQQEQYGRTDARVRRVGTAERIFGGDDEVTAVFSIDLRRSTLRAEQLAGAFLASGTDARQKFEVESVVACQPAEVKVSVSIEAALCPGLSLFVVSDPLALLRGLRAALVESVDLGLATRLAYGRLGMVSGGSRPLPAPSLNAAQTRALQDCLDDGVNVVWGPPGTGKTSLLASFLSRVVSDGRSALLVSNTNVAVDEALLRTEQMLGGSRPGQLVRAGAPANPAVADHPHLPLDRAIRLRSAELTRALEEIEGQIRAESAALHQLLDRSGYREAKQRLSTFPPLAELVEVRARCQRANDRRRLRNELSELESTVADFNARHRDQGRRLDQLRSSVARAQAAEQARIRVDQIVATIAEVEAEQEAAQLRYVASIDRYVTAATAWVDARAASVRWWHPRRLVATNGALARSADTVDAARASLLISIGRWADVPDRAERRRLHQVAAGFSPERLGNLVVDVQSAQNELNRLDRDRRDAEGRRAAASRELSRIGDPVVTEADRALVERASAADVDGLSKLVALGAEREGAYAERRSVLLGRRKRILDQIAEQHPAIVAGCQVLATTTAAFASSLSLSAGRVRDWDYVVIDEASACLYPYLAFAATRAKRGLTVVGDFLQNGPISAAAQQRTAEDVSPALTKDVFDLLHISANSDERAGLTLLDTQYRFAEQVAAVANRFGYEGRLRTEHRPSGHHFRGLPPDPLVVLDVSTMPGDFQLMRSRPRQMKGSWLAGVAAALELAGRVPPGVDVGVVTVYKEQADVTSAALSQHGLPGEVGTSHRYQGREFPLAVFDTSEPMGYGGWVSAAQFGSNGFAHAGARLCNVALTRCQSQVVVVVDQRAVVAAKAGFLAEIRHAEQLDGAPVVRLADLIGDRVRAGSSGSGAALEFELAGRSTVGTESAAASSGAFLTAEEMYVRLPGLLDGAQESVEIWSSYVSQHRVRTLLPLFERCAGRGTRVVVHCKPTAEIADGRTNTAASLEALRAVGVEVVERFGSHEKVVLIDGIDGYYGSLNLLSHAGRSSELMVHLNGEEQAAMFRATIARSGRA